MEIYHKWNINKYGCNYPASTVVILLSEKKKKRNKIDKQAERNNGRTKCRRAQKNVVDKIGKRTMKLPRPVCTENNEAKNGHKKT